MYTAADVYSIIDTLPVEDRWAVVAYTLDRIKEEKKPTALEVPSAKNSWIDSIAGTWSDMDDATAQMIEDENSKIDIDGWNFSL